MITKRNGMDHEEMKAKNGRVYRKSECAGSVCSNCKFWEGIDELGSFIEGTCFAMMRVTGYAETCDEFTPNADNEARGE